MNAGRLFKPEILDPGVGADQERLDHLIAAIPRQSVVDTMEAQLRELIRCRHPGRFRDPEFAAKEKRSVMGEGEPSKWGRWIHYPWSGRLVRVLPPHHYHELRQSRNRHKITQGEQDQLRGKTLGIVGLSVGNSIAVTLAMEGVGGCLKLADFDELDLSNLNRVRSSVADLGTNKAVLAARQILEIDPYLSVQVFPEGITRDNVGEFLTGKPAVDLLIDECDSLDIKLLLREWARKLACPVLMESSDRGCLDVERFDLEPGRPPFHGLLSPTNSDQLSGLSTRDKVPKVLEIVGASTLSAGMAASLLEIDQTLATWPQLASEVALGGGSTCTAARCILLGQPVTSGRSFTDRGTVLFSAAEPLRFQEPRLLSPSLSSIPNGGEGGRRPGEEDPRFATSTHVHSVEVRPLLEALSVPHRDRASVVEVPEHVREIIEAAALAPSGGNSQPWIFHFDGESVWIEHDKARGNTRLDASGKGPRLALGAAIENASITAASLGRAAEVELFPCRTRTEIVARIRLHVTQAESLVHAASMAPIVRARCTNRRSSPSAPLSDRDSLCLKACVQERGARLTVLRDRNELNECAELFSATDRVRFLHPELHREAMSEMRWSSVESEARKDGLDLSTLCLAPDEMAALSLLRREDVVAELKRWRTGRGIGEWSCNAARNSSAILFLGYENQTPAGQLTAGRILQQLWLEATRLGLAVQPMGVILFLLEIMRETSGSFFDAADEDALRELESRLQLLLPGEQLGHQVMIFRVSYGMASVPRSLRRPWEEIVRAGNPLAPTLQS